MRHGKRGFTVLEVIIAIFLIAMMSAAVIPALMGRVRDAQTSALSQTLFALSQAIFEYRKAMTVYPDSLTTLATRPVGTPAVPSSTDACGTAITAATATNWRGPYVSRELVSSGLRIGDATISSDLRRVQLAGPPASVTLFIDVHAVDTVSVYDIEDQFDGGVPNAATGTIRYQSAALGAFPAAPAGTFNLSYGIPMTGC